MNKDKVQDLEAVISNMDIPFYRKTIKTKDGLRWLARNLKIRNIAHKDYPIAERLIKELL